MTTRKRESRPTSDSADALANLIEGIDYRVDTDDFVLYELARLIEEDRASFEDEEFRRIIDGGIRTHVEERPDIRAKMAMRLRQSLANLDESAKRIARRTIHALEDMEFPLLNVSLVVRTYTAHIFRRLQDAADQSGDLDAESRSLLERWHTGEILREEMTKRLRAIGPPAVGPLADLLFEAPEDRMASEMAIETLGAIRCASSARVLAHAILEPILEEDLEARAFALTRSLWPLPRHYILYTLSAHTHEDLSFRWFQLLIESNELLAVDLILDELLVHADSPAYHEDLKALLELIRLSHDPDVEEKIVAVLNSEDTPREAARILEGFASSLRTLRPSSDNPWARATQLAEVNRQYLSAAKLHDSGRTPEALRALEEILQREHGYPFAVGLKRLI
jgi:hypothetical protein